MPTIDFTDPDAVAENFETATTYSWDDPGHPNYDGVDFDALAAWLKRSDRVMIESNAASQEFADKVEITGYGLDGRVKPIAFSNRFAEPGIGVSDGDGRWNGQIDFYQRHPDEGRNVSEKLELDFNGTVDNVILTIGMLGAREGPGNSPETGIWTALDADGNVLATGKIGPSESINGNEGIYGEYRFAVDAGAPIAMIWIEATGFGYGSESGEDNNAYLEQDAAGNSLENNSDIGLAAVSYDRLDYESGETPPPADPPEPEDPPAEPEDPPEEEEPEDPPEEEETGPIFGSKSNDMLFGTTVEDELHGLDGNDMIFANVGHDVVYAGMGDDSVWGGKGRDTVYLGQGNDIFHDVSQNNGNGRDTVYAGLGNDRINGGGGDDEFYGMMGQDFISGALGDDKIYAGKGYDTVFGGNGNDTVWGGNGRDVVILGLGDDVFYDDAQTGEHSHDRVFAGLGNDTLHAGGGNNTFTGGGGDDTFVFNTSIATGTNVITDFALGEDSLQLSGVDFQDLNLTATGTGVRIDWDQGSVKLDNVALTLISETDFTFV